MSKTLCIVSCPIDTYSGYGARSRDLVDSIIRTQPDWDVKILFQRWGNTRWGYLKDHNRIDLLDRQIAKMTQKPDVWIQITIPNEFQPVGTYNIGVTAGIETTLCAAEWIQGINRMDLTLTSSTFAKDTFEKIIYTVENNQQLRVTKPIEVLFEGVDPKIYYKAQEPIGTLDLSHIKEPTVFLVVGHWLQGREGHDRKNLATTVRTFLETFKNRSDAPALLLKTQQATSSIMDKYKILEAVNQITHSIKASKLPSVYVLHGDLTDAQMNQLYNDPKVKAMVSLTKGEGFGRPLLEFSTVGKPIIASGWSGHLDFLSPDKATLIPGMLEQVDNSVQDGKIFMQQAQWFKADTKVVSSKLKDLLKNPKPFVRGASSQRAHTLKNFTITNMDEVLAKILLQRLPNFPKFVELKLPKLELPKLVKIEN